MIRNLCDSNISAYKAGTQQMVNLVLDIICLAMRKKKKGAAFQPAGTLIGKFIYFYNL